MEVVLPRGSADLQLLLDYRCYLPPGEEALGTHYPPDIAACMRRIADMTPQQASGREGRGSCGGENGRRGGLGGGGSGRWGTAGEKGWGEWSRVGKEASRRERPSRCDCVSRCCAAGKDALRLSGAARGGQPAHARKRWGRSHRQYCRGQLAVPVRRMTHLRAAVVVQT